MQEHKKCTKCGETKLKTCFYPDKRLKSNLVGSCKKCISKYRKKWHQENLEKSRESSRKWRKENLERAKEYEKKRYKKNPERTKEYNKKWHQENPERARENGRKWRKENPERAREYNRKWKKEKRRTDISFKIEGNLRVRIYHALNGEDKSASTRELIGADPEFVKKHLESQFEEGMSWDNNTSDGWHKDHIIPCASFDLSDPEQQKKCFHWSNLQPLWAKDNLSKGAKLNWRK